MLGRAQSGRTKGWREWGRGGGLCLVAIITHEQAVAPRCFNVSRKWGVDTTEGGSRATSHVSVRGKRNTSRVCLRLFKKKNNNNKNNKNKFAS